MEQLRILTYPNEILRRVAKEVHESEFRTPGLMKTISNMAYTMHVHGAVGLAGPQVGIEKRIIFLKAGGFHGEMINPIIMSSSNEKTAMDEGCLSFPGDTVKVVRPQLVTVKYCTYSGAHQVKVASGLLAKAIQHEIDHLNGILFIEHGDLNGRN